MSRSLNDRSLMYQVSTEALAKEILFDNLQKTLISCFPENDIRCTRDNIIQLLNILADALDPIIQVSATEAENDFRLYTEHSIVALLRQLSDMFRDLENGKTCETFQPNPYGATATLRFSEQKQYELLEAALLIAQRAFNLRTKAAAVRLVEKKLNKAGWKRRNGEPYSDDFLRRLSHRPRKYTPVKR